jgi:multisubunit Na+/H+ antiporter MnhB subunit
LRPRHLAMLAIPLVLAVGGVLLLIVAEMPVYGEVNPTFNYVVDRYNQHGLAETGATNIITAIILDYRAYDTLIETTVLFTATMGVLLNLKSQVRRRAADGRRHHP